MEIMVMLAGCREIIASFAPELPKAKGGNNASKLVSAGLM